MKLEKSAGVIIFRKDDPQKYLLLHYRSGHWGFAKGHIEDEEESKQAAIREVAEETGITDLLFVKGFKRKIHYFHKKKKEVIFKTVTFFLAQTNIKNIQLSQEHVAYKWLPFKEALAQLTYKKSHKLLGKADAFLTSHTIPAQP